MVVVVVWFRYKGGGIMVILDVAFKCFEMGSNGSGGDGVV